MSEQMENMGAEFIEVLQNIRNGIALDEAGTALRKLVQSVREVGKPGSLTLTITLKPEEGDRYLLTVADKLASKPPERVKGKTYLYGNDAGALSRRDPRQTDIMDLKGVDREKVRPITDAIKQGGGDE